MPIPNREFAAHVARTWIGYIDEYGDRVDSEADKAYRRDLKSIQGPLEVIAREINEDSMDGKGIKVALSMARKQLENKGIISLTQKMVTIKQTTGIGYSLAHPRAPLSKDDYKETRYSKEARKFGFKAGVKELRPLMDIVLEDIGEPLAP